MKRKDVNEMGVVYNNKPYEIKVGDTVVTNPKGSKNGFGTLGTTFVIRKIEKQNEELFASYISILQSSLPMSNDELINLSITMSDLVVNFNLKNEFDGPVMITGNVVFRNKNLKGMPCRVLSPFGKKGFFVELEEDIGAGSCDGLGKRGRCVLVNKKDVGVKDEGKEKEESRGKESL